MSLKKYQNINLKKAREQGFTIVELLIVIIVIAILAALVITAYNGVQNKARANANKSDAKSLATAASAYAERDGGDGRYPATISDLNTSTAPIKFNSSKAVDGTAATNTNGVAYERCPASGNVTGANVYWYNNEATSSQSTKLLTLGTC